MSTDAELLAIRVRLEGGREVEVDAKRVAGAVGDIGEEADKAAQRSERAGKRIGGALDSIGAFGRKARETGRSMTFGLTLPIVGLGAASVHAAGDFERSMAQVQVASGAGEKKMGALNDLALRLGAETKFSAGEAGEAMLELAKSGITPAQIQAGALKSAMDLAAAGSVELASAANLTGAAMNTFELGAGRSKQIADALAGGANASAADVSDLAQALSQGGSSAAAYGFSLNEAIGALAAFSERSIRGSDAGTAFKTFLARLNPETTKAKELMEELGLSFFDAGGNMKSLPAIAGELQSKLAGLSQKERESALQTLFGTDAIRAARVVYAEGTEGIARFTRATEKQGAASQMAEAFMQGSAGKIEEARGAMETAAITAGVALAPAVAFLAENVASLFEGFASLPEPVQNFLIGALALVAIAGPMLWMIGAMATGIQVLGAALLFASANPIVLIIAGIVALGAGLVVAYNKVGWFRDAIDAVGDALGAVFAWIKGNWPLLLGILTGPFGLAVVFIAKHWGAIKGAVSGAVGFVLGFLRKNWPYILGILAGPVGLAAAAIFRNWDRVKGATSAAVGFVGGKIGDLIGFFRSLPGRATSILGGFVGTLADWGKAAGEAFVNALIGLINEGIASINSGLDEANALSFLGVDAPNIPEIPGVGGGGSPDGGGRSGGRRPGGRPKRPPRAKPQPKARRELTFNLFMDPNGEAIATGVLKAGENAAALS